MAICYQFVVLQKLVTRLTADVISSLGQSTLRFFGAYDSMLTVMDVTDGKEMPQNNTTFDLIQHGTEVMLSISYFTLTLSQRKSQKLYIEHFCVILLH